MTDITYDAEADTVHITVGRGKVERTKQTGPFACGVDAKGQIVGIEIRSASKVLAPGHWRKARRPKESASPRGRVAERHRGFIFIKRFSPSDAESQK
jgi:uncharacterized protein YuzE